MRAIILVLITSLLLNCNTIVINPDGSIVNPNPDYQRLAEINTNLALEYLNHNASNVALQKVNAAISANPNYLRAYMVRAMIYQSLTKNNLAERDYKFILKKNPNDSEAKLNYAIFLCSPVIKNYSSALNLFVQAINDALYQNPELAYLQRGICFNFQHENESAAADYLKAMSYNNPPNLVYYYMAQLQYDSTHYALANFYINRLYIVQNAQTLWLRIKILHNLLINQINSQNNKYYHSLINLLGKELINNYDNSIESIKYLNNDYN